ncbi:MAG: bacillithiol biosynthesis deacetylase BshB1 [Armatimonadetes bacterium]|nr:bacillithiol biosynthesis deacetylase BshB1 [Armatimonadota bacterium]
MAQILVIGAHPDDAEIGMGGTILKLGAQGHTVTLLDLTNGEPTPMGTPEQRAKEAQEAALVLGVERRITLPLPNRYVMDTVENRKMVAEVIREVRPDYLFIHYWEDAHPDHVAACRLCEAARFYGKLTKTDMRGEPFYPRKVFHFEAIHYRLYLKPSFIMDISDQIGRKLEAIACYRSQFNEARGTAALLQTIKDINRYWGALIRRTHGEPFVCREEIGLAGLDALV